jgi:hypothetical protein
MIKDDYFKGGANGKPVIEGPGITVPTSDGTAMVPMSTTVYCFSLIELKTLS